MAIMLKKVFNSAEHCNRPLSICSQLQSSIIKPGVSCQVAPAEYSHGKSLPALIFTLLPVAITCDIMAESMYCCRCAERAAVVGTHCS